jgi:acyl-CoA dehydrogenase
MRVVGKCQRAFDMMCERALSRRTQGKPLSEHQFVQGFIADSAIQLQQFRLLVLQTAWIIDNQPHGAARKHIAMCKVALASVLHDILQRAVHLHGSLGTTQETPLGPWWSAAPQLALADGPTEVHKAAVAKLELRGYQPAPGLFPTEHIPTRRAQARARYAAVLEEHGL